MSRIETFRKYSSSCECRLATITLHEVVSLGVVILPLLDQLLGGTLETGEPRAMLDVDLAGFRLEIVPLFSQLHHEGIHGRSAFAAGLRRSQIAGAAERQRGSGGQHGRRNKSPDQGHQPDEQTSKPPWSNRAPSVSAAA